MIKSTKTHVLAFVAPKYPELSERGIAARLEQILKEIRAARQRALGERVRHLVDGLGMDFDDAQEAVYATAPEQDRDHFLAFDDAENVKLEATDKAKIARRAAKLHERRQRYLPNLKWLRDDAQLEDIYAASRAVDLQGIVTPDESDEIIARIHDQMPWLAPVTTRVMKRARARARRGEPFHLSPLLLVGPPGIGKSSVLRRLADAYGMTSVQIDAGASGGGVFALTGTERGWGSAHAGIVVKTIIEKRIANPVVIVDELDKGAERATTTGGGRLPGLHEAVLAMLEPETARRWRCPYYGIEFDLSHITWIFTSNTEWGIPDALRSRLTILRLESIRSEDVAAITMQIAADRLEPEIAALVAENLARRAQYSTVDLRTIRRHIEKAEEIQSDEDLLH